MKETPKKKSAAKAATNASSKIRSSEDKPTGHNIEKKQKGVAKTTQNSHQSKNAQTSNNINSKSGNRSQLQNQFAKKLEGARFRVINEELYTAPSNQSYTEFQRHPEKFEIYHKGYREQAVEWPINPLHVIIDWIKNEHQSEVIVDMGCGEAKLAESLVESNTVHSFDLVAGNERVTACDMAHVPLEDGVADIVVFCLSLMGVNVSDFIREAHRLLKVGGLVKIVEVRSRFENEDGIKSFLDFLRKGGFKIERRGVLGDNKMFFDVELKKLPSRPQFDPSFSIKSCLYKKR